MKKKYLVFFICIIFAAVVSSSIFSLILPAIDTGASSENGKWKQVCCGSHACPGGIDSCTGSGSYKCCK